VERVVIVGGGVSGLVANYVFKTLGQKPVVFEPREPGGEFLHGGLKYIHRSKRMVEMFDRFRLPWSDYSVQGGILLRGEVLPYPKCLSAMSPDEASRIQADHFIKTRRSEPGQFGSRAMNDPAAISKARRAIRCDFIEMVRELADNANIVKQGIKSIRTGSKSIQLSNGEWYWYDKLILTIPLWVIKAISDVRVPEGMAMALNLIQVKPRRDPYARWDYVYTPYTPGNAVHRFSPREGGYSVEVNGDWATQEAPAHEDLAFIFQEGFLIEGAKTGLKGHLLELHEQPVWPTDVAPLGRFAKWDPRITTDVTLEDCYKIAEGWGWIR